MSPLLDSRSYGLRPVRNPLISGALQQCGKKLLVESDSHNRAGPSPDRGPPRSRTGQPLKVVTSLSFVSPGLDLLVAHTTSVEKMLAHGNIVYETRSWSLPPTATLDSQTPPLNETETPPSNGPRCFWTARSSRPSLTRRRRSAGRRTCSRRSRAASRRTPSLAAPQARPSS